MELSCGELAPPFAAILATCEPFLVTYPANHPALDLAPFGLPIPTERRYTATALASRGVVDGLHVLDGATFGDQEMAMPRWVLFDCGEFPGVVFGFGRRASGLSGELRRRFGVEDRACDDAFVPLSMWVAIRCAEDRAWFGHNLSSVNVLATGSDALPGLATLTKAFGVKVARAERQYGATQWASGSIGLHLKLGDMRLLSAFTPAHTHPETLSYRIEVDEASLTRSLRREPWAATRHGDRVLDADDASGIRALQDELERGEAWTLVRAERRPGAAQRLHLVRG